MRCPPNDVLEVVRFVVGSCVAATMFALYSKLCCLGTQLGNPEVHAEHEQDQGELLLLLERLQRHGHDAALAETCWLHAHLAVDVHESLDGNIQIGVGNLFSHCPRPCRCQCRAGAAGKAPSPRPASGSVGLQTQEGPVGPSRSELVRRVWTKAGAAYIPPPASWAS